MSADYTWCSKCGKRLGPGEVNVHDACRVDPLPGQIPLFSDAETKEKPKKVIVPQGSCGKNDNS